MRNESCLGPDLEGGPSPCGGRARPFRPLRPYWDRGGGLCNHLFFFLVLRREKSMLSSTLKENKDRHHG